MNRVMHYRTWAAGRTSYVKTVVERDDVQLVIRPDGFVQINGGEDAGTLVPTSQVLAIRVIDDSE